MARSIRNYWMLGAVGASLFCAPAFSQEQAPDPQQPSAPSEQGQQAQGQSHQGEFVESGAAGQFTMSTDGNQHEHQITEQTKITLNGRPAKIEDLQAGDHLTVTTGEGNVATAVAAERDPAKDVARQPMPQEGQQQAGQQPPAGQGQQRPIVLGVRLGQSPTTGVYVLAVRPGSPAAIGGIQARDYILSINGRTLNSMEDYGNALSEIQPGNQAEIIVWRNEQRQPLMINFDERRMSAFRAGEEETAGAPPAVVGSTQSSAWLGVALEEEAREGQQGVRIAGIYPSGPAARAGLRTGDVIVQAAGTAVASPEQFVELIGGMQPHEQVELGVMRGDQQVTLTAMLADRSDFLDDEDFGTPPVTGDDEQFEGHYEDFPEHSMMLEQHRRFAEQHERIENQLQDVLEEVRALRQELQELRQK